ncbi:unnamed protein product [Ilex paraguariensis]|uniref:Malectin-like domain-containing protein n=1 Tax=Ilex paraguariensis TaxID=185542 RepID=A0ABC8SHR6_9AQUA
MAIHRNLCFFSYITFSLLYFTLVASFSPTDHYLINCGSTDPTTVDIDNRRFTGDLSESGSQFLSATRTISVIDSSPVSNLSPIYHTARIFTRPSKYSFKIRDKGTHLVRFHFHGFNSSKFNLLDVQLHVLANGYVLLHDFSIESAGSSIIKDYMIWVDTEILEITFMPSKKSKRVLINAIEVISAPKDLIADVGQYVSCEKNERVGGLMRNAFETVHRVNMGGSKVTPFNDSLWRTWVPDDQFLKSGDGSEVFYFGGRIKYQKGGASREVCPDNVYNTARLISSSKDSIPDLNITWAFPVVEGYKYLVRMHFCDIASVSLGMIFFNVYVNGNLAYENLDLTAMTNELLASPFYADFVVDWETSGVLAISVGPSKLSRPDAIDAILNGIEIMKMNNSMGSLNGAVTEESVVTSWPKGNNGVLLSLIAAVCLLLTATIIMRRRSIGFKDVVAWSALPVDIPDVNLKSSNKLPASKV